MKGKAWHGKARHGKTSGRRRSRLSCDTSRSSSAASTGSSRSPRLSAQYNVLQHTTTCCAMLLIGGLYRRLDGRGPTLARLLHQRIRMPITNEPFQRVETPLVQWRATSSRPRLQRTLDPVLVRAPPSSATRRDQQGCVGRTPLVRAARAPVEPGLQGQRGQRG